MAESSTPNLTTTFLLLKSHEPSCPPTITDAGSQAGQAFNQNLRFIAGLPGFHSMLFGWPPQPESEDTNVNEWMASILPGMLGMFVNWDNARSAQNFLSSTTLTQALQGLTSFFEVPQAATTGDQKLDPPLAYNVAWTQGDAANILKQTKLPLEIALFDQDLLEPTQGGSQESDQEPPSASGTIIDQSTPGSGHVFRIRHVSLESVPADVADSKEVTIVLSLMRTRWCSRLKEDLYDTIRARRVD